MSTSRLQFIPYPGKTADTAAAVSDGRTVWLSQLTAPPQPVPADIRAQTGQCLALLDAVLQQAGSGSPLLLRVEFTVADSRCIPAVQQVWDDWRPTCAPAPIWRFGRLSGTLVAVDAVAAVAN